MQGEDFKYLISSILFKKTVFLRCVKVGLKTNSLLYGMCVKLVELRI